MGHLRKSFQNLRLYQNLRSYQNLKLSQNLRSYQNLKLSQSLRSYQNLKLSQNLRSYQNLKLLILKLRLILKFMERTSSYALEENQNRGLHSNTFKYLEKRNLC